MLVDMGDLGRVRRVEWDDFSSGQLGRDRLALDFRFVAGEGRRLVWFGVLGWC